MLDTNICIYIRQRRPEEVLRRCRKLRPGEAVLSVIGAFAMKKSQSVWG
jgi:tRNA(fMet)-specific endonuclease VapC